MKKAVFSNGHTDVYKGKRDVKAAWMITTPDGKIVSGHSLDKETALKTAKSQTAMRCTYTYSHGQLRDARCRAYLDGQARTAGFANAVEQNKHNLALNAAHAAKCKIEIVDII